MKKGLCVLALSLTALLPGRFAAAENLVSEAMEPICNAFNGAENVYSARIIRSSHSHAKWNALVSVRQIFKGSSKRVRNVSLPDRRAAQGFTRASLSRIKIFFTNGKRHEQTSRILGTGIYGIRPEDATKLALCSSPISDPVIKPDLSCSDLGLEISRNLLDARRCSNDGECGQIVYGTGCGPQFSDVVRQNANLSLLHELIGDWNSLQCDPAVNDSSFPPVCTMVIRQVEGVRCRAGICDYKYVGFP